MFSEEIDATFRPGKIETPGSEIRPIVSYYKNTADRHAPEVASYRLRNAAIIPLGIAKMAFQVMVRMRGNLTRRY